MKKVIFVTKYPFHAEYSIKKKFDNQMQAVRALGYDVYHTAYDEQFCYLIRNAEKVPVKKIAFGSMPGYIHTKAFLDMYDTVLRALREEHFDYAYIRSCPLTFLGCRMIRKLSAGGTKVVVEIPTYPAEKEKPKSLFRRVFGQYSAFWWKRAERHCALFTLIGEKADRYHGRPAINIDNGIQTDRIPLRHHEPRTEGPYHLLALASMSKWQGYDRLIEALAQLEPEHREKIVIDLVGNDGDGSLAEWKAMAEEKGLQDQVICHGYLTGEKLNAMFNIAVVGIGTLGLYRKDFFSGSILKIREYMARGLPFVYSGDDPALAGDEPYCMKVPNDDTPVDMAEVLEFALRAERNPDYLQAMRTHAKQKMSWETQFEKVFEAVENI